jgi:hypothetical protein
MGAGARISSSFAVMKKSRLSKCMCTPKVQLMLWLAIHGLMRTLKRAKDPLPGAPTVGVLDRRRVNL